MAIGLDSRRRKHRIKALDRHKDALKYYYFANLQ